MISIRRFSLAALLATTIAKSPLGASAAEIHIIANVPMKLSAAEVREIFLGERQFVNGQRLVVIDNVSAMPKFVDEACGIDTARYQTVWAKKGFREGLNPPVQLSTDRDVLAIVRRTPGAIGYVTSVPAGGNVVLSY